MQVLGGCISGSEKLISKIRLYHHVIGGVINPVSELSIIQYIDFFIYRPTYNNRYDLIFFNLFLIIDYIIISECRLYDHSRHEDAASSCTASE